MTFAPAPRNDFAEFCHTYHQRCRRCVPAIRAIAAKWTFEDLIPGLSDFDTRFIVADGMTADDWHAMSLEVGRVHAELARQFRPWARNLEHLPGMNLTVSEMIDPAQFYPEFAQWTLYEGDERTIGRVTASLAEHRWSRRDERFHLKKVATYFGPYLRGIDPPINIGPWENKYPLHSRYMHYFTPAVQAMVSLGLRRSVRGKFESLRLARHCFPNPRTIDMVLDAVDRHYELPDCYAEPKLTQIERELERYLGDAWATLAGSVTCVTVDPADTRQSISAKIAAAPADPVETFASGVRFARLMEGRLRFYAQEILWFDSAWLIRNELGRIVSSFCHQPLTAYGQARYGEALGAEEVLDRLQGDLLTSDDAASMRRFMTVAGRGIEPGTEKQRALEVANIYRPVLLTLLKLGQDLPRLVARPTSDTG